MGFFDCFTGGSVEQIISMYAQKPIRKYTSKRQNGHLLVTIYYTDGIGITCTKIITTKWLWLEENTKLEKRKISSNVQ
jgi:predicted metal-dependent peptidase